jgi:trimeric autotransporter adhesin
MTAITRCVLSVVLAAGWLCSLAAAQSVNSSQISSPSQTSAIVPRLVNFSGKANDPDGKIISGTAGAAFAIYNEQSGGAPLWMETQNVTADSRGNYTVQLGATKPDGLPLDLFTSGEARWLGVRINGGEEGARVLLLSVPYALKAADAETVGGLPASAFMLAGSANAATAPSGVIAVAAMPSSTLASPATTADVTTSGGTVNTLPLFTTATNVQSSILTQTGSGATGKIGFNTTTPATVLDVNGGTTVRGTLALATTGTATATAGKNSQPLDFTASAYNSSTKAAVAQKFQWQAEPAGNDTTAPTGTMNLLYASGTGTPAETGLKITNKGLFTFAAGQTFPGTGKGSVTSVGLSAPSADFVVSGSPVTGSGTLGLQWNIAPTSNDNADAIVKRDSTGSFTANNINSTSLNVNGTAEIAVSINTTVDAAVLAGSDSNSGLYGTSESGNGVTGYSYSGNGIVGFTSGADGFGVYGTNQATDSIAIYGYNSTDSSSALVGEAPYALIANGNILAGEFIGDVEVEGSLSEDSGSFKIEHPLDPANKYLYHSFVESPDMMNIYNGNVITDAQGDAIVSLPDWFEALNTDFRYQLTVLGQFAQAIVSNKVANHQFSIKTDKPNVEVSWQVTGIRHDAWANAHRIPVEQLKPANERGFYKHPELYNAPPAKSVMWARHPNIMKQMTTTRRPAKSPRTTPIAKNAAASATR